MASHPFDVVLRRVLGLVGEPVEFLLELVGARTEVDLRARADTVGEVSESALERPYPRRRSVRVTSAPRGATVRNPTAAQRGTRWENDESPSIGRYRAERRPIGSDLTDRRTVRVGHGYDYNYDRESGTLYCPLAL